MALYFLLLDGAVFHAQVAPALAVTWRQRSWELCRPLCAALVPAALAYAQRYHTGPEEPLLCRLGRGEKGPPFDRDVWRLLAGEVLLYAAADVPEVQTAPATLCRLLAPDDGAEPRETFSPVQQAHYGARDLAFGGGFYRPEHAGYNDTADVTRLAEYLAGVDPGAWRAEDLAGEPDFADDEERAEEVALARECLAALRDMYQRAASAGQVIVCEVL